jgi:hypothetical protein
MVDENRSPGAFFHGLLTEACRRLRVKLPEETAHYLINLLTRGLAFSVDHEPLAFMLKAALEAPPTQRRQELKRMGDTSLFLSGFFPDSLTHKGVDVHYYAAMGSRAYDALSQTPHEAQAPTYQDLAARFLVFVDVLGEMSARSMSTSESGILRLYSRYLHTGANSPRLRQLLAEQGLLVPAIGRAN